MLRLESLTVSYGAIRAVSGVSIEVGAGEAVALIGANGAGKSSILKAVSGLLAPETGIIRFDGDRIDGRRPAWISRNGIGLVPEGREILSSLTVDENLIAGTFASKESRRQQAERIAEVYELFPVLQERRTQAAGTLSGGEQQMLAIGRALVGGPRLLMLDEPSMGLAPLVVESVFSRLEEVIRSGLTVLLVEQNAEVALSVTQRAYVLSAGQIVAEGTVEDLKNSKVVLEAYLGLESSVE